MSIQTAMILAAGRGERLRPLTDTIPKPLVQVGEYRLIEYHLHALSSNGVENVIINTAYLGEMIAESLGDGSRYGLEIHYSVEPAGALETAGGIHHALPLLGEEPFIVVNGDIRTDYSFSSLALQDGYMMHLVLVPNPPHHAEGDFSLDSRRRPAVVTQDSSMPTLTFSGIGVYRPEVFRHLPEGRHPLGPLIREQIQSEAVSGEMFSGYWIDVGDMARLEQARKDSPPF